MNLKLIQLAHYFAVCRLNVKRRNHASVCSYMANCVGKSRETVANEWLSCWQVNHATCARPLPSRLVTTSSCTQALHYWPLPDNKHCWRAGHGDLRGWGRPGQWTAVSEVGPVLQYICCHDQQARRQTAGLPPLDDPRLGPRPDVHPAACSRPLHTSS